jgi:hypothetical protein
MIEQVQPQRQWLGFTKRKRMLSPDQYEIVDVRTSRGVQRTAGCSKAR